MYSTVRIIMHTAPPRQSLSTSYHPNPDGEEEKEGTVKIAPRLPVLYCTCLDSSNDTVRYVPRKLDDVIINQNPLNVQYSTKDLCPLFDLNLR